MAFLGIVLGFLISLFISTLIIYFATKIFGEKEGLSTAVITAFAGALIFTFASYFIGIGWIAALIGGVIWLFALSGLYKIGWLKSFVIAVVIWIFAAIIGLILPTLSGPL